MGFGCTTTEGEPFSSKIGKVGGKLAETLGRTLTGTPTYSILLSENGQRLVEELRCFSF